jgi:hypothetical protein
MGSNESTRVLSTEVAVNERGCEEGNQNARKI